MKKLITKYSNMAFEKLLPEDYNPFNDPRDFSHDEFFKFIHDELERIGVDDSDYEYCPKSINPQFFENVRYGKEIHEIIL